MNKEELKKIIIEGIEDFSEKVSDLFEKYDNDEIEFEDYDDKYCKLLNKITDNILAKIPDDVVIAKGQIDNINGYIGNEHGWSILNGVYQNYDGKYIRLTLQEIVE